MPKNELRTTTVTIGAGASLSGASIDLDTLGNIVAIITDAAWDTNAMGFQGSVNGIDFFPIYKEAAEYSLAGVTASTYHSLDDSVFYGVSHIKILSGTIALPVAQIDATTIRIVTWHVDE